MWTDRNGLVTFHGNRNRYLWKSCRPENDKKANGSQHKETSQYNLATLKEITFMKSILKGKSEGGKEKIVIQVEQ